MLSEKSNFLAICFFPQFQSLCHVYHLLLIQRFKASNSLAYLQYMKIEVNKDHIQYRPTPSSNTNRLVAKKLWQTIFSFCQLRGKPRSCLGKPKILPSVSTKAAATNQLPTFFCPPTLIFTLSPKLPLPLHLASFFLFFLFFPLPPLSRFLIPKIFLFISSRVESQSQSCLSTRFVFLSACSRFCVPREEKRL